MPKVRSNAIKRLSPEVAKRAIKKALKEGFDMDEVSSGELLVKFDFQGRVIAIRRNYGPF